MEVLQYMERLEHFKKENRAYKEKDRACKKEER
jgi:hypothetical protein